MRDLAPTVAYININKAAPYTDAMFCKSGISGTLAETYKDYQQAYLRGAQTLLK
jgi:hypothetical protein